MGFIATQFASGDLEAVHLHLSPSLLEIRFGIIIRFTIKCTRNALDGFYSTRKLLVLSMAGLWPGGNCWPLIGCLTCPPDDLSST